MPKIRHLAVICMDPEKLAKFYCDVFEMTEVTRNTRNGRTNVFLTDGYMNLALLSQKAEHEYAGVPVGIMDQTIVAGGKAGHAMLLDCRNLSRQFVPLDTRELRVVIVNSMVRHELSEGEYGKRRQQWSYVTPYDSRFDDIDPDGLAL